jgi:hypothetical protein
MDKEQVSAAPADREAWMKEATMTDLHAQIMNIPCKPYDGTDAYTHYCRGHRDARHAAAELASEALRTAAPAVQQDGWMPIESAPKNRKVLVAYKNSLGKWRRVMASYATAADIEEAGEDSGYGDTGAKPGWYEECESQKTIMPVEGEPELWHELPPIDAAADHIADAGEMVAAPVAAPAAEASADECIDLACALEQRRALKIVDDVHNLRIGGRAEVMPTAFHAGYCLACEEIEHRLRTEQWGIDGAPVPLFGTSAPAAEAQTQEPTKEQALAALDDMDDFARMQAGVDAIGPRETLRRFIEAAPSPQRPMVMLTETEILREAQACGLSVWGRYASGEMFVNHTGQAVVAMVRNLRAAKNGATVAPAEGGQQ